MFVGTGSREIKKEEIAEGGSLGVTTPSCACEPVPGVETDVTDSGAQSESVNSELAFYLK